MFRQRVNGISYGKRNTCPSVCGSQGFLRSVLWRNRYKYMLTKDENGKKETAVDATHFWLPILRDHILYTVLIRYCRQYVVFPVDLIAGSIFLVHSSQIRKDRYQLSVLLLSLCLLKPTVSSRPFFSFSICVFVSAISFRCFSMSA